MRPSAFWDWSADDRAHALALAEFEASLNSLGIPIDEATSADADRDNHKGTHYYEAEGVIDHSLLAEARYRSGLPKDDAYRDARIVRVRRVERVNRVRG